MKYPNRHLQHIQRKTVLLIIAFTFVSSPVFATSKNVEEAIALLKQSFPEQCQRNKLKVKLLVAHRKHDQGQLQYLESKLDEINASLKSTDDKINALKAAIKKNSDEDTEFNTALLDLGSCE